MSRTRSKLLLVEDHRDTATSMEKLLSSHGYEVHVADSCGTAERLCRDNTFDLLLVDLGLPDGDGAELVKKMSAHRPLKAIALTGYALPDDVARCASAGFLSHIAKPIIFPKLLTLIQKTLHPGSIPTQAQATPGN